MKNHIDNCPKCKSALKITRYDCPVCGTRVEGEFTGCTFCRLSDEDRMFALIFIQTEGNMKDVERVLNISYPTIKARLARINKMLAPEKKREIAIRASATVEDERVSMPPEERTKILDRLASGDIDAKKAGKMFRGEKDEEVEKE